MPDSRLPFEDFMPPLERIPFAKNMELRFEVFRNKRMKYVSIGIWKQTPEKYFALVAGEITVPLHVISDAIPMLIRLCRSYASNPLPAAHLKALPAIREACSTPDCPQKETLHGQETITRTGKDPH